MNPSLTPRDVLSTKERPDPDVCPLCPAHPADLTHSHTLTPTPPHDSHLHTYSVTYPHMLTPTHTVSHTLSLILTHSHSVSLTHIHTLSLSRSFTHSHVMGPQYYSPRESLNKQQGPHLFQRHALQDLAKAPLEFSQCQASGPQPFPLSLNSASSVGLQFSGGRHGPTLPWP